MSELHDPGKLLTLDCPHCGTVFWGPKSLKGGYASCPQCRKAFEVKGGPEAAFWILFGLGAVLGLGFAAGAVVMWGWTVGLVLGGIAAVVLVACALAM